FSSRSGATDESLGGAREVAGGRSSRSEAEHQRRPDRCIAASVGRHSPEPLDGEDLGPAGRSEPLA
ncbi:unnamed protein product, partial [Durusdinium trenchii]